MAELPQLIDPTLEAMNQAIEQKGNNEQCRTYLGMSSIGMECRRSLWYQFRWCSVSDFNAATLRRFEDGHRGEDLMAERLRMVPEIILHTHDPRTGEQFGFVDIGGHFRGHMDGGILGLYQAPKTWHVWEHKCTNEKKHKKLITLREQLGEKNALKEWDPVYYSQGVLYMDYSGMDRHYLTCSTPGERDTTSVRTNPDKPEAKRLKTKAKQIIFAKEPLERENENPSWYKCKWCEHHSLCHGAQVPEINCRTCVHSTPAMNGNGQWMCEKGNVEISTEQQRIGCMYHLFIPALIPYAKAIDADEQNGWIEYQLDNSKTFKNGRPETGCYTSWELQKADPDILGDDGLDQLRVAFDGRITGS